MRNNLYCTPQILLIALSLLTAVALSSPVSGTDDPSRNTATLQKFEEAVTLPTLFERRAALFQLVANADVETLTDLLIETRAITSKELQEVAQEATLLKFASLDPTRALSQLKQFGVDKQIALTRVVFQEWSMSNLKEAITHAKKLDEQQRQAAFVGIWESRDDLSMNQRLDISAQLDCQEVANDLIDQAAASEEVDDPDKALEIFISENEDDLHIGGAQVELFEHISRALVEKHGASTALRRVDRAMARNPSRVRILVVFLDEVAKDEPELAFQLATGFRRGEDELIAGVRILGWTETDPETALKTAVSVQDRELREWVLRGLGLSSAPYKFPQQILGALGSSLSEADSNLVGKSVSAIARKSPEVAVEYLSWIQDAKERLRLTKSIVRSWSRRDALEALNWINTYQESENIREELLPIVMKELTYDDHQLALQTALEMEASQEGISLEAGVIEEVANFDVDAAIAMLPSARDQKTKFAAAVSIGRALVGEGDSLRALGIAQSLPQSNRNPYIRGVLRTWNAKDPRGLFGAIEQLPTDEIRNTAATLLLDQQSQGRFVLSESEEEEVRSNLYSVDPTTQYLQREFSRDLDYVILSE